MEMSTQEDRALRVLTDIEGRVWNAHLAGRSMSDIAQNIHVERHTVSKCIKRLRMELSQERSTELEEVRAVREEHARLPKL